MIVRADNEKLTDRSDLGHILRSHHTGGKMTLVLMRDKHEQTIMVTLPDRGSRDSSMLDLDTEELASLGNVENLLENLNEDEGIVSLSDSLATLNDKVNLLDLDRQLEITPETEKLLQELKTCPNPI